MEAHPTICWYQLDYSTFTVRQASRRSWRIGQRQPVHVHYLVYGGTLQAKALHLVATKMQAALAVEGDLTEDGLAGLEAEDDFFLALARQTVADGGAHGGGLEALFASAGEAGGDDDLLLDRWDDASTEEPTSSAVEVTEDAGASAVLSFDDFVRRMGLAEAPIGRRWRSAAPPPKEQLSLFD